MAKYHLLKEVRDDDAVGRHTLVCWTVAELISVSAAFRVSLSRRWHASDDRLFRYGCAARRHVRWLLFAFLLIIIILAIDAAAALGPKR